MSEPHQPPRPTSTRRGRLASVAALLVLAPVCAEYLAAYDDSTGNPAALLGGLVIFVPLYGAPALLIREVGRRYGLGWVGMALLATAFGLLQAGVVDESLFNADYREIDGWEEMYGTTLIAPWGVSAVNLVGFVSGHAIYSICAPIALVEAARPARARRPWLGRLGLGVTAVAYVGASALVLVDSRRTEGPQASPVQLTVTLGLVVLLVGAALVQRGIRSTRATSARPAVRVWTVFALAVAASVGYGLAPQTWLGVGLTVVVLAVAVVALARAGRTTGWSIRHVAAAAAAPLLVRAVLAFTYAPLVGDVSPAAALGHHVTMLALVALVLLLALRPAPVRPPDGPASPPLLRAGRKAR